MGRTAVFRVDASTEIATGHVMRCLGLADELRVAGISSAFVSRELPGNLFEEIARRDHALLPLSHRDEPSIDSERDAIETRDALAGAGLEPVWLVVDHYGLDADWEHRVGAARVLAIDDCVGRAHDCDVLLNPNLIEDWKIRYAPLLPPRTRALVGLDYAPIRREFRTARRPGTTSASTPRRVLVCYGGVDLARQSERALLALREISARDTCVDVVIGAVNPAGERLQRLAAEMYGVAMHVQPSDVAAIFARADLALCAGGGTLLELLYLGVPALVTTVAENQVELTRGLAQADAVTWLGDAHAVTDPALADALRHADSHRADLARRAARGRAIVDGHGIERVVRAMLDLLGST